MNTFWTLDGKYAPFSAVRNLQKEMNKIFNTYESQENVYPAVNIWSNDDELFVTASVPGINPEDIDITVVQGQLEISGNKKNDIPEGNIKCHRQERTQGTFKRSFRLPFDVNNENVKAEYKNGILAIILPRLEESKPKKIKVNVK
jgi:HSP20 family protein